MKPYEFQVTDEQIAQEDPKVQEALLRLWREHRDRGDVPPDVWQSPGLTITARETYDDSQRRLGEILNQDGSVDMTHLYNPDKESS